MFAFSSARALSMLAALAIGVTCAAWVSYASTQKRGRKMVSPSAVLLSPHQVPRVASYRLNAVLDVKKHSIGAEGTIRWTNPSRKPTKELFFHLYLNAFENEKTLFQRGKGSRSGHLKGRPGSLTVHSLKSKALGPGNLWKRADKHSPGDPEDRTDIRLPLPRAIRGGETIEFQLKFTAQLPKIVERTGFQRDFHLVGQWFPKIAKREPNGTWAHFAFHPQGEFYADFGNYDVTLDVPSAYVVGSTGHLEKLPRSPSGRTRYRARAESVHDFAWTAWPHFVVEERELNGTRIRLLHPPHSSLVAESSWEALEHALPSMNEAYGPYPFPDLTVVQPPSFASRAGGMEYPQFITTGGTELLALGGLRLAELVTVHELGHQWFQGLLASNEAAHPFLDEGLTSYAEARVLREAYGDGSFLDLPWLRVSRQATVRYHGMRRRYQTPIVSSVSEFPSFGAYANLVYARTSLALETLGRVYSFEKLHDALRDYAHTNRFGHPRPNDFFRAIERQMGPAARHQAELIFRRKGSIDYSIDDLVIEHLENPSSEAARIRSSVRWKKTGKLEFPTFLLAQFSDGTHQTRAIRGKGGVAVFEHSAPLAWAHLDPGRQILLDDNLENNRAFRRQQDVKQDQLFHSGLGILGWALAALAP